MSLLPLADDGPDVGPVEPCRLVDLSCHADARGSLTVVDADADLGFPVRRAYWLHDLPDATARGAHAHRRLRQLIVAVAGSFDVVVDDGRRSRRFRLDRPDVGLRVGPLVWRDMVGFAPGTVGLWLVSEPYDEAEYIRDHDEFRALAGVA